MRSTNEIDSERATLMEHLDSLGDDRILDYCVMCGGLPSTRDHIPAKIFLDQPYPSHLHHVGVCYSCNNGLSLDEEYVACAVECAVEGAADPNIVRREKIRRALEHSPALTERLRQSFGTGVLTIESERFAKVVLKCARGHALYELHELLLDEPTSVGFVPLALMDPEARQRFEAEPPIVAISEVGSRASQRMMVIEVTLRSANGDEMRVQTLDQGGWIEVQEGRYRYLAFSLARGTVVRMVFSDYLACEVIWRDEDEDAHQLPTDDEGAQAVIAT